MAVILGATPDALACEAVRCWDAVRQLHSPAAAGVLYCTVEGSRSERPNGREGRPGDGDKRDGCGRSGPRRCIAEPLAAAVPGCATGPPIPLPALRRGGHDAPGVVVRCGGG